MQWPTGKCHRVVMCRGVRHYMLQICDISGAMDLWGVKSTSAAGLCDAVTYWWQPQICIVGHCQCFFSVGVTVCVCVQRIRWQSTDLDCGSLSVLFQYGRCYVSVCREWDGGPQGVHREATPSQEWALLLVTVCALSVQMFLFLCSVISLWWSVCHVSSVCLCVVIGLSVRSVSVVSLSCQFCNLCVMIGLLCQFCHLCVVIGLLHQFCLSLVVGLWCTVILLL